MSTLLISGNHSTPFKYDNVAEGAVMDADS
jgi:hypothetical protein